MADLDREKQLAAERAVELVEDGMLLGLGTGTTANHAIRRIARRVRDGLRIQAIPTSFRTRRVAEEEGIPLVIFEDGARIDLTIDGTDEVDPHFHLIKGGGGALLHEKIVAAASHRVVIIADSTKEVPVLGRFPLPVEVVPFGWRVVAERVAELGARVTLRQTDDEPFRTDEGNYILDCAFGRIPEPRALSAILNAIPGLVEHGLFIDLATTLILGRGEEVELREHPASGTRAGGPTGG